MKIIFRAFVYMVLIVLIAACNVFSGGGLYEERNVNGFRAVTLSADVMNRLSFGTSSRAATGSSSAPSGCAIQDSENSLDGISSAERKIVITAQNTSNNAGKIAGSEDGLAYYFKEVDKSKNFRLSADFYIEIFGFSNSKTDLNGQEGFGIMARDYVPQCTVPAKKA